VVDNNSEDPCRRADVVCAGVPRVMARLAWALAASYVPAGSKHMYAVLRTPETPPHCANWMRERGFPLALKIGRMTGAVGVHVDVRRSH
jgi:hypothetical protein